MLRVRFWQWRRFSITVRPSFSASRRALRSFGSFASGRFRPGSDVDVAVHSKSPLSPEALADLRTDLSVLCRREVDLADLSRAEGMFLLQIMTKGERVKFDHAVYHRYVMKALGYREDFLPIQRACWDESVRRLIDGQGPASS